MNGTLFGMLQSNLKTSIKQRNKKKTLLYYILIFPLALSPLSLHSKTKKLCFIVHYGS